MLASDGDERYWEWRKRLVGVISMVLAVVVMHWMGVLKREFEGFLPS